MTEQTPKCSLCKSKMTDNARTATYYCANDDCAMRWEDLTREAVDALNTHMDEAARLRAGLHEFLEDFPRAGIDRSGTAVITVRAIIKRIEAILGTAKVDDEMKGPYVPKRWRRVAHAVVECHECRNNSNPLWCDDAGEMECCHCGAKLRAGERHADECPVLIAKAMLGET